jgi:hypothetical protein
MRLPWLRYGLSDGARLGGPTWDGRSPTGLSAGLIDISSRADTWPGAGLADCSRSLPPEPWPQAVVLPFKVLARTCRNSNVASHARFAAAQVACRSGCADLGASLRASHSPLATINAPPPSVHASGAACQNTQSNTSAQARALYSKGAMAAAWP